MLDLFITCISLVLGAALIVAVVYFASSILIERALGVKTLVLTRHKDGSVFREVVRVKPGEVEL